MNEDFIEKLDETEEIRRLRQNELNQGWVREDLEAVYGQVWTTDELRAEWEVQAFIAPLAIVKSKSDGGLGSFEFQHRPRYYFNYVKDQK